MDPLLQAEIEKLKNVIEQKDILLRRQSDLIEEQIKQLTALRTENDLFRNSLAWKITCRLERCKIRFLAFLTRRKS